MAAVPASVKGNDDGVSPLYLSLKEIFSGDVLHTLWLFLCDYIRFMTTNETELFVVSTRSGIPNKAFSTRMIIHRDGEEKEWHMDVPEWQAFSASLTKPSVMTIQHFDAAPMTVPTKMTRALTSLWQLDPRTQCAMDCSIFCFAFVLLAFGGRPEFLSAPKPWSLRYFVCTKVDAIVHTAICVDPTADLWLSKMGMNVFYIFSTFEDLKKMYSEADEFRDVAYSRPDKCENSKCVTRNSNGKLKLRACLCCYQVAYCGRECQIADWNEHKKMCEPFFPPQALVNKTLMSLVKRLY
jgi:hypothetical protein